MNATTSLSALRQQQGVNSGHNAPKGALANNNPFGQAQRAAASATTEAAVAREVADVQAAMVIAKRFPRDQIAAMDSILRACTRPTLAAGALYVYSRGGTDISGPSIRLAEVMAQCWGNITFGIREIEQRDGESTVEAFAHDIETNTRQSKTFQVAHIRHTKKGAYRLEDPRDIYELIANQGARRLRACILGIIPGDVQEAAVRQCDDTLRANADTSPDALLKLAAAFEKFGVSKAMLEKRIQCRLEAIRPAQIVQLRKVYASLQDGMSNVGDWFEVDGAPLPTGDGALDPAAGDDTQAGEGSAQDDGAGDRPEHNPNTNDQRAPAGAEPKARQGRARPAPASGNSLD